MSYFYDQLEESKKRDDKAHEKYDEDDAPYEAEDVGNSFVSRNSSWISPLIMSP